MLGENRLIFALDPKLEVDAETLVLHSGPKFLCLVVYFYKHFWFWYQTGIVSEKVYAAIWPVLEITSLKFQFFKLVELWWTNDFKFVVVLSKIFNLSEKISSNQCGSKNSIT